MLKNFRTYQLAKVFYTECEKLKLPYYLRSQLSRSSSSVVLNLAEGCSRSSKKDRRRFYEIALGSFLESKSILEITSSSVPQIMNHLGASLFKLYMALK